MSITVKINGIDKTNYFKKVSVKNNLNSDPDTAELEYYIYGNRDPGIDGNDDIAIYDGASKIFGGIITKISKSLEGGLVRCRAEAKDYSEIMDGRIVFEIFEKKTVNYIIDYLVNNYLTDTGITMNNVNCDAEIAYIVFNGKPVSKCIDELADLIGYCWYIDPDKDIHFFARGEETAPMNLTDTSGGYVFDSLEINFDWSNIINSVIIDGGSFLGEAQRHDFVVWESDFSDYRREWPTVIEYGEKPSVYKDYGTYMEYQYSVGVNGLDNPNDYEVMWDFNGKWIRFREDCRPTITDKITLIGREIVPIRLLASDQESINQYGIRQKYEINKNILSYAQAAQYAASIMDAYKDQICEGGFKSTTSGWRAGQLLNINSTIRGVNQDFIIKSVDFNMRTPTDFEYNVSLITQKTLGVVDVLQKILLDKAKELDIDKSAIITKHGQHSESLIFDESVSKTLGTTEPTYVIGEHFSSNPWPTDTIRTAVIDGGAKIS